MEVESGRAPHEGARGARGVLLGGLPGGCPREGVRVSVQGRGCAIICAVPFHAVVAEYERRHGARCTGWRVAAQQGSKIARSRERRGRVERKSGGSEEVFPRALSAVCEAVRALTTDRRRLPLKELVVSIQSTGRRTAGERTRED